MSSSKYGSSSGGGGDPFRNTTSSSMSKKSKESKNKKGSKKSEEEQSSRRRAQNRNSQRAYRERREQRLRQLESEVQQAEMLNQTLTTAYQELKAEIDRIEAEKTQEQYYGDLAGQSTSASAIESAAYAGSGVADYGQGSAAWEDYSYVPEQWEPDEDFSQHGA